VPVLFSYELCVMGYELAYNSAQHEGFFNLRI
jgi:hypothetical protein